MDKYVLRMDIFANNYRLEGNLSACEAGFSDLIELAGMKITFQAVNFGRPGIAALLGLFVRLAKSNPLKF